MPLSWLPVQRTSRYSRALRPQHTEHRPTRRGKNRREFPGAQCVAEESEADAEERVEGSGQHAGSSKVVTTVGEGLL